MPTFKVEVLKIATYCEMIEVEAVDRNEAMVIADSDAYALDFGDWEEGVEYEVGSIEQISPDDENEDVPVKDCRGQEMLFEGVKSNDG